MNRTNMKHDHTKLSRTNVRGKVVQGARVASGLNPNNPFQHGTIELQRPHFEKLGLDLSGMYMGTINIDISPLQFRIMQPQYIFHSIKWIQSFAAEDFSLSTMSLSVCGVSYTGFLYYPHPETKHGFHKSPNILEVISPFFVGLQYGTEVVVSLIDKEVEVYA